MSLTGLFVCEKARSWQGTPACYTCVFHLPQSGGVTFPSPGVDKTVFSYLLSALLSPFPLGRLSKALWPEFQSSRSHGGHVCRGLIELDQLTSAPTLAHSAARLEQH